MYFYYYVYFSIDDFLIFVSNDAITDSKHGAAKTVAPHLPPCSSAPGSK